MSMGPSISYWDIDDDKLTKRRGFDKHEEDSNELEMGGLTLSV